MREKPQTTEELVRAAQRGDRAALDELLTRHLPSLRAYVRVRASPVLRAQESASDLVMSTCREVCKSLEDLEFRDEAAFRGWLFQLAWNKIQSRHRYYLADKRHPGRVELHLEPQSQLAEAYAGTLSPSGKASLSEEVARLETAFDRLPEAEREVLGLARFAELSHREIAERMGRTEKATRDLLHRAMVRLTGELRRLEQQGSEPGGRT